MKLLILLCLLFIGCAKVGDPCVIFAIPDENREKAAEYTLKLVQTGRMGPGKAMDMAKEIYGKQMSGKVVRNVDNTVECSCAKGGL